MSTIILTWTHFMLVTVKITDIKTINTKQYKMSVITCSVECLSYTVLENTEHKTYLHLLTFVEVE